MSLFKKIRIALLITSGPIGWIILGLMALKNREAVFGVVSDHVEGTPWEDVADAVQTQIETGIIAVDPEALEVIAEAAEAAEGVVEFL
jgi:hypothetical protein